MKLSFFSKNFIVFGTLVAFSASTFSVASGQQVNPKNDSKPAKKVNIFARKAAKAASANSLPSQPALPSQSGLSSLSGAASSVPPSTLGSLPPLNSTSQRPDLQPKDPGSAEPIRKLPSTAPPSSLSGIPNIGQLPSLRNKNNAAKNRISMRQQGVSAKLASSPGSRPSAVFPLGGSRAGTLPSFEIVPQGASNLDAPANSLPFAKPAIKELSQVPDRQQNASSSLDNAPRPNAGSRSEQIPAVGRPSLKVKQPASFTETPAPIVFGVNQEKGTAETASGHSAEVNGASLENAGQKNSVKQGSSGNITLQIDQPKTGQPETGKPESTQSKPGPLFRNRNQKTAEQLEAERNRQLDGRLGLPSRSAPRRSSNFGAGNRIRRPNQAALIENRYYDARSIGNSVRVVGPNVSSFTYSPQIAATRPGSIRFIYNPARPSGQLLAAPALQVNPEALRQPRIILHNNRPRYTIPVQVVRPVHPQRNLKNVRQFIQNQ